MVNSEELIDTTECLTL